MTNDGIDILLERRNEFEVGDRRFTLYPPSLGVTMMMKGAMDTLNISAQSLVNDTALALIDAVERERMQCCRIIALATCCGRKEAMKAATIDERAQYMADNLDDEEAEADKKDFISRLNPESLKICRGYAEKIIADAETGTGFQFLRTGYFCKDPDSAPDLPVYNRTVGLRDTFAKQTNTQA